MSGFSCACPHCRQIFLLPTNLPGTPCICPYCRVHFLLPAATEIGAGSSTPAAANKKEADTRQRRRRLVLRALLGVGSLAIMGLTLVVHVWLLQGDVPAWLQPARWFESWGPANVEEQLARVPPVEVLGRFASPEVRAGKRLLVVVLRVRLDQLQPSEEAYWAARLEHDKQQPGTPFPNEPQQMILVEPKNARLLGMTTEPIAGSLLYASIDGIVGFRTLAKYSEARVHPPWQPWQQAWFAVAWEVPTPTAEIPLYVQWGTQRPVEVPLSPVAPPHGKLVSVLPLDSFW